MVMRASTGMKDRVGSLVVAADDDCDVEDGTVSLSDESVSVKHPASKAVAVKAVPDAVH
jgi:hypothetical protein